MARITVDDCLKRIPNRFDMTLVATARARQLAIGSAPMVEPAVMVTPGNAGHAEIEAPRKAV